MGRVFEARPAIRSKVPLWINIVGPSGTGKTFSALRLATGMSRIYGDGVSVIDTEARRSEHYADLFKFHIVDFKPPFGPEDYWAAIEHCLRQGAKTVVIDSMSHEWEGEGGVLETHEQEAIRLAEKWRSTPEKCDQAAWQAAKKPHRRMLSKMVQTGANFILCYRAKEKLKVIPGQQPRPLGWQPVGPDDLAYESTLSMLLLPGAGGVPSWNPSEDAEKARLRLPNQFKALFAQRRPLDEETGEALATWAAGGTAPPADGARSARQGAPAGSAAPPAPTSPPADEAALAKLEAQLVANGKATKQERGRWFEAVVGRRLTAETPPTEAEVRLCLERAEAEAAA